VSEVAKAVGSVDDEVPEGGQDGDEARGEAGRRVGAWVSARAVPGAGFM